jgi:hypothetical protein
MSLLHALGLSPSPLGLQPSNHAAGFIITNFFISYIFTASRPFKAYYGFDHNVCPREDLTKYGDALVQKGRLSARALARVKRLEAAHANSMEHFPFFFGSMVSS